MHANDLIDFGIDNHLDKNGKIVNKSNLFSFGIGEEMVQDRRWNLRLFMSVLETIMLNYRFKMVNQKQFEDIERKYKGRAKSTRNRCLWH